MKFLDELEKKQRENPGKIIIVKNGIFFIAVGKDALVLNKELGLKVTCMKNNLCKVGFQVKNVEKYIPKLEKAGNSFGLYIKNETGNFEEIYSYSGNEINEVKTCLDCSTCKNKKEEGKDILERVIKLGKKK